MAQTFYAVSAKDTIIDNRPAFVARLKDDKGKLHRFVLLTVKESYENKVRFNGGVFPKAAVFDKYNFFTRMDSVMASKEYEFKIFIKK